MSIFSLKIKLQRSIQTFALAIIYATAILFVTAHYGTDRWVIGLLPVLITLSIIGQFIVARAIVRLTSLTGNIDEQNKEEFENRFAGISGINGILYALIPLTYSASYVIALTLGHNILDLRGVSWPVSLSLLVLTCYFLHKVINELSFAVLFISIIYGWTNIAKANKIKRVIDEIQVPESIDLSASFKRLAKRYTKRIEWLENNIEEKNEQEYQHKISIYQNVLRDFEDLMNGIDA